MAHYVDALGRSRASLHVSTAIPCHDLGIDDANSRKARLLSVPCRAHAYACACACAPYCLEPYRTHACQRPNLAFPCVHPCLQPGHSRADTHVAPNCSCTLLRVLSATSLHGPNIDASVGKARCFLSDPPCACALGYISVVIATPCRDTDTLVQHANVDAYACDSACACDCASAYPRVCARTPRRYMACPLDAAHTLCVPMATAPCHDACDFGPRTREQLELLCVLCWKLWDCRNSALWDNKPVVPSQIIEKAVFFLTKYNAAISSKGRGAAGVQWMSETKWRPPAVGFTKVNVDGAIFEQQQLHGVGVVARNSIKEVLAAMISKGQGLLSVEETEACNLRKALKWAKDLMFNKIGMEMNCATCSKNWKNSSS
ncbi:hypothetical protein SLEP1_g17495 [Rubroshorea leprosula]|uniref:RNase H type-1 domain-containing protein n=1 Tax=Rubroshorea leprosula TaxID=152421 RepID=A0AAV5J3J8_9ROSI|nr:hypothetical protein SLEP1_g17495 [Rubroshorea leprosula]